MYDKGGVLFLPLLNIYVNGLSELFNKSGVRGTMGGTIINHMLYVDDICIVSTFNAKKSRCMYFSIDINKHFGLSVINLGNCVCQFVKELKYLSVMIHSSIKTTIDVKRQTHFICKQIPGIALMMSSVHCFSGFCIYSF